MNHNGVFTVSNEGMSRMMIHNQWIAREAPKRGLRDPWLHRPDRPLNQEEIIALIEGKEVKATKTLYREATDEEMTAWKAERDEYMRQRDEWVALQMFHKFGYEDFLAECRMNSLSDEFCNSVLPCESKKASQCSMFCPIFNTCALRFAGAEGR